MKRLLVSLVACWATAAVAQAEWNPPARYDHDFTGKLTIRYLPQRQVVDTCRYLFARFKIEATASSEQRGCAVTNSKWCVVVAIDKPYRGTTPRAVVRHEIGHCNGWPASHPD